jgi:glycosyltransferase involved in cell wall biosynthesis
MPVPDSYKLGYVVKRYPRFSETFVVNEILAHEAAGQGIDIFSLRGTEDTHFQDILARVRASVTYLPDRAQKASDLWSLMQAGGAACPGVWQGLPAAAGTDVRELAHACALAAHASERGIAHLHAHFATSAATVARLAARFAGIPFSLTAHAKDIFHDSVDPADLHAKLRDATAVVTVSDYNLRWLSERFPDCAHKLHRIYNGLDLQRFRFADPADRAPLIVGVGRLIEKKGFESLIDACRLLKARGKPFRCIIVGGGELETDLRRRIAGHGLDAEVSLEGPRPQSEVMALVQSAAVFAAPCVLGADGNRDGLPTVLLEAMALGTPCVATDVTGIPELIRDDNTGLMTRQHDAGGLADALAALLDDPARRSRIARHARALMEAELDVHRNSAALRRVIAGARAPRLREVSV